MLIILMIALTVAYYITLNEVLGLLVIVVWCAYISFLRSRADTWERMDREKEQRERRDNYA